MKEDGGGVRIDEVGAIVNFEFLPGGEDNDAEPEQFREVAEYNGTFTRNVDIPPRRGYSFRYSIIFLPNLSLPPSSLFCSTLHLPTAIIRFNKAFEPSHTAGPRGPAFSAY